MKITSVKIRMKKQGEGKTKAYASVLLDDCFMITNIRVVEGDRGYFISMPREMRRNKTDENGNPIFDDIAFPINRETRTMFEEAIIDEFNKVKDTEV